MNHFELLKKFPDDISIIRYFIRIRYEGNIKCNHCGSSKIVSLKNPKFYQCNGCNQTFSIFKGTIFEKTRVSLQKWILAINFVCNNKKSLSACQLQREIGGSYETSWRMLHQIRKAMSNNITKNLFDAIVEVDETYVGGKPRKGSKNKSKRGRGSNSKTPVIGVLERESGRVYAKVALPNAEGKKLTGKQLLTVIDESVKKDATIMSDEFRGYRILDRKIATRIHLVVNHSQEFVRGDVHTNNIENFWSLLKRGVIGSYHHISVKYMQNYVDEFSFRFSERKNPKIFDLIVKKSVL